MEKINPIARQPASSIPMTEQDQVLLSLFGKLQLYFFGKLVCNGDDNPRSRKSRERIKEDSKEILSSIVSEIDGFSFRPSSRGGIYC